MTRGCHMGLPYLSVVALAVRTPRRAQRVIHTGIAVAEPMIYELFFFENRVQSENLSAAPP
jgi:hypothetical protein